MTDLKRTAGRSWSETEDAMLRAAFARAAKTRDIYRELDALGFVRTVAAVRTRLRELRLYRKPREPVQEAPPAPRKRKHDWRRHYSETVDTKEYWEGQKGADRRFQEAMRTAGFAERTSKALATERPLIVSRPVTVRSSGYGDAW